MKKFIIHTLQASIRMFVTLTIAVAASSIFYGVLHLNRTSDAINFLLSFLLLFILIISGFLFFSPPMNRGQQGQNQRTVRELSAQEVSNYFYPRPTPAWNSVAIIVGIVLLPASIILHSLLLLVAGLLIIAGGAFIIYKRVKAHPDDERYDAWVGSLAVGLYERGLDTLNIQLHNQDRVLTIHSYVLPGSLAADAYPPDEVLMKYGRDGHLRFSVNVYTIIICTNDFLAIFESDVNAFSPLIHRDIHEIYDYRTIFSATSIALEDTVLFAGQKVRYRTEQFCLKFTNGETMGFSAAVRARPWGNMSDVPVIKLPSTGFDKNLSNLRQILFHHQK